MEIQFPFLGLLNSASSTSTIVHDEDVLLSTAELKNVFMFSKDNSNFAASCSGARIFTKKVSREWMIFLPPSERAHDVVARTEKSKRIVKHKGSAFNKVRVKEVARSRKRRAKIESEWLWCLLPRRSRVHVEKILSLARYNNELFCQEDLYPACDRWELSTDCILTFCQKTWFWLFVKKVDFAFLQKSRCSNADARLAPVKTTDGFTETR